MVVLIKLKQGCERDSENIRVVYQILTYGFFYVPRRSFYSR